MLRNKSEEFKNSKSLLIISSPYLLLSLSLTLTLSFSSFVGVLSLKHPYFSFFSVWQLIDVEGGRGREKLLPKLMDEQKHILKCLSLSLYTSNIFSQMLPNIKEKRQFHMEIRQHIYWSEQEE